MYVKGKVSWFGSPADQTGVTDTEPLAFIYSIEDAPHLFLPYPLDDSTGLARRLNPFVHYLACCWDYTETPREMLLSNVALVTAIKTGIKLTAFPADWGPNPNTTDKVADLSPGLMMDLGIETGDICEIVFPYKSLEEIAV